MIQELEEINEFHRNMDPWDYKNNPEDAKRLEMLLSELPKVDFKNVLDIGCGQGFITKNLPGESIIGVDISSEAVRHASVNNKNKNISFRQGSIFNLNKLFSTKFDLIIITGVLYPQYIGKSSSLIYKIIDNLLSENGFLVSVHINDWYDCQFPYLKLKQHYYPYRSYDHKLEIYAK